MAEFKIIHNNKEYSLVGLLPSMLHAQNFVNHIKVNISPTLDLFINENVNGKCGVFIATTDSNLISTLKIELIKFMQKPGDLKYTKNSWEGKSSAFKTQRQIFTSYDFFSKIKLKSITSIFEILCIIVYLCMFVDENTMIGLLAIFKSEVNYFNPLFYIKLITPVFLHFSILHIAFNLVMFEAFARKLEDILGNIRLLCLILIFAIVSNYLQLLFMDSYSVFGGMSGVVYGLIAYSAMLATRERFLYRLNFPKGSLVISAIFIVFGFFLNSIANLCHLGGMLIGIAIGLFDRDKLKL